MTREEADNTINRLDDFIEYAKKTFGIELTFEKSDNPDTYEKLFGTTNSVTSQEPKIGHWISHREHCENLGVMPSGLGAYEWCSNCDCGIDVREWHRNHYNYCPNCGAKMVELQESEG